jgi:hypothetical protein
VRKKTVIRVLPPSPPRIGLQWFALSAAVNVGFLIMLAYLGFRNEFPGTFELSPSQARPVPEREYVVYFVAPPVAPTKAAGEDEVAATPTPESERPARLAAMPAVRAPREAIAPPVEVPKGIPPVDSLVLRPLILGRRPLKPSFGDGRLWVTPRLTDADRAVIALRVAEIDSAFRERLIEEIGKIPPDSFALAHAGSWVTEVGGKQWGIDQQWIYLGGVKIPTMLLALLPIPQGNIDQSRAYADYERMRQEVISQSRRMEDREDIKRYIKEMEARMRDERERQRLYVAIRDTTKKMARDTIIP